MKIIVFQSAGLVRHTRTIANLTARTSDEIERVGLATAALLMGAAALESLAMDTAYHLEPNLWKDKGFRKAGVPDKLKRLTGADSPEEVNQLWTHRLAVTHGEPLTHENSAIPRTQRVGEVLNALGAKWVADVVESVALKVWGPQMPDWFTDGTGLLPMAP